MSVIDELNEALEKIEEMGNSYVVVDYEKHITANSKVAMRLEELVKKGAVIVSCQCQKDNAEPSCVVIRRE